MSSPSLSTRVGIFVFISLVLLGGLVLSFSKGVSLFRSTYTLHLETANVGGIKEQAAVLLGGLRVGSVSGLSLGGDGKTVRIRLRIDSQYPLRGDARFTIEQSGFIGDQHVAIYPSGSTAPLLADGDTVRGEQPFNLQEAARAATSFIQRIDQTAQKLHDSIERIDRTVLSETTLSNINLTLANFRLLSERTLGIADRVDQVVGTHSPSVGVAITNLLRFAESMERLGSNVNSSLDENRGGIGASVRQIEEASRSLSRIAADLQAGEGLAGSVLKDPALKESFRQTVQNFAILSSNLSHYGLLHKPRPPRVSRPTQEGSPKGGRGASTLSP